MFDQIINFTSIFTGLFGLFVIVVMLLSYKSNIFVNGYLIIIFLAVSGRFIHKGIYGFQSFEVDLNWLNFLFLFIVPNFYLYFKSLFQDNNIFQSKDLYHFIYPILNLIFIASQRIFPGIDYGIFGHIVFIGFFIFLIYYIFRNFYLLFFKLWRENETIFTSEVHFKMIKKWVLFFYSISLLLSLRLIASVIYESDAEIPITGHSYSIIANLLWLVVFVKILLNPEILYGYPKLGERLLILQKPISINQSIWELSITEIKNTQDLKLNENIQNSLEPYFINVENFIKESQPFRKPDFSIIDLSKKISVPASHLAYIFKYHCKMSFVEFKNYCRIKDALKLLEEGYLNSMTFESLAYKTGFNSYNSFFIAFKKETGFSPKDFIAIEKN